MVERVLTHTSSMSHDLASWAGLATGDTGAPVSNAGARGAVGSIQFSGTFGGATATLEGSNDGTTWFTLKDTLGNLVSLTAAGLVEFSSAALYLRPSVSGGTGVSIAATAALQG